MKITSEKAPSEAGRRCKGYAIVIINKASVWLQHKVRDWYQLCPWRDETMQSCSEKSNTPFWDSVRGGWSVSMVCSVPFAQMSWQKIPSLFIYKNSAQHVYNFVWIPRTDLLAKMYLFSVRRNDSFPCTSTPQVCIVISLIKVKMLFHADTLDNKFWVTCSPFKKHLQLH